MLCYICVLYQVRIAGWGTIEPDIIAAVTSLPLLSILNKVIYLNPCVMSVDSN
jgi:hypothetical protein